MYADVRKRRRNSEENSKVSKKSGSTKEQSVRKRLNGWKIRMPEPSESL